MSLPSTTTDIADIRLGVVCRAQGDLCDVALLDSQTEQHWLCSLRGRLKRQVQAVTSIVATGDEVRFRIINDEQGVIESIEKRRSKLSRESTNPRKDTEQILAVNIDYAVIVMACHAPDFNPRRLDWHLTAALAGDLSPIIVISKVDLPQVAGVQEDIARYRLLGYPVISTSTKTEEGIPELSDLLAHKKAVLVGSSGVGKSSLINAMDPGLHLRTGELRAKFNKGRHVTTAAELLRLSNGAWLIDTPGVRSFALWDKKDDAINEQYGEFEEYAPLCRFSDCSHTHEPGCAVREAVERGDISAERYEAYQKIIRRQQSRRKGW
ncbi:MAG: ribosome small subunit-dependent GTPase A [Symbiobacteriaceae bacterium]|nr:ribosome small subunit-dependent GTPase A [Symbiobacteriaceae bacterium]